tara:strand:+ start:32 stop:751 length:720 start_codon:yes stop_codon:yes gene_type:complete
MKRKLILLRHGESQWNLENKFTGWMDVDLTKKGIIEAQSAGSLIFKNNINIDIVYCSYLKRAVRTCKICLDQMKSGGLKVKYDWRLNERHYGALQGLNKSETTKKHGKEQVLKWRRSYDIPPPKMKINDEKHPSNDKLYKNVDPNLLPSTESLKDTLIRVKPLILSEILQKIKKGSNVLIVAHGNSLRAIFKIIKKISDKDIINLNIPTGAPYVMKLNKDLSFCDGNYLGNVDEVTKKI